jgi:hypothetical protein
MNVSNLFSASFKGVCKMCGDALDTYHWRKDKNDKKLLFSYQMMVNGTLRKKVDIPLFLLVMVKKN